MAHDLEIRNGQAMWTYVQKVSVLAILMLFLALPSGCGKRENEEHGPRQESVDHLPGSKTSDASPVRFAHWETVAIPGICTYQIPPTLEIQKGTYKKISDQFRATVLEISASPDRVVAQPKGVNEFDPVALSRYCRVIVETQCGAKGDYAKLDDRSTVSDVVLGDLDKELKAQTEQAATLAASKGMNMAILSWQPTRIVQLADTNALLTSYTRSMNNAPPAIVRSYKIQNNDCLHTITISYRESEGGLWADDFGRVIETFSFHKR